MKTIKYALIHCFLFLTVDVMWPVLKSSCLCDFPEIMGYTLRLLTKLFLP